MNTVVQAIEKLIDAKIAQANNNAASEKIRVEQAKKELEEKILLLIVNEGGKVE